MFESTQKKLGSVAAASALAGGSPIGALAAVGYASMELTKMATNQTSVEEGMTNLAFPGGKDAFLRAAKEEGLK